MRRIVSSLLSLVVLFGGASVALASQSEPGPTEMSPGITGTQLLSVDVDALPEDASVVLFARYTVAPGAEIPPSSGLSIALFYVESGELTVLGAGPLSIMRAGASALEPKDPGAEAVLTAGDAIYSPVCASGGLRNDGAEPVSLLLSGVTGFTSGQCPGATPEAASTNLPGVSVDFLALGSATPLPALPAQLAMAKLTYDPGAADPQPAANSGTVLARVDSGTFGLTMTSGEGTVIRKPADPNDFFSAQMDPLVAGEEATLNPGDIVWEASGTVTQARNIGTEPATVAIFVLVAAPAVPGTPVS